MLASKLALDGSGVVGGWKAPDGLVAMDVLAVAWPLSSSHTFGATDEALVVEDPATLLLLHGEVIGLRTPQLLPDRLHTRLPSPLEMFW
ncbi:MAG: hypothetical protein IPP33_18065 [Flavobacteriales bacterium]|nr:hypothetical protein [Flavobacteriales bacterium]